MSAKSELCIFDRPSPQVVIEHSGFEEVYPLNNVTSDNTDIEFYINGSQTEYLDLNDTLMYINVQAVEGADGAVMADLADVQPSNYLFHMMFKDVILSFNNTRIEGGNGNYAHKAIIETLINYNNDTKSTSLTSMGYFFNDALRKAAIAKSRKFSMCSSLQLDFMDQPKYLIPGVNIHIRIKRSDPKFCLEAAAKLAPHFKILDAKLLVRRVRVDPSVLSGHTIGLTKQNAVYPIRNKEVVAFSLAKGSSSFYKEQIFGDRRLPNFLLVTFQTAKQFVGDYSEKSSNFKHFNTNSMTLYRNSDYRETYTQDFVNDDYSTTYMQSIVRNFGYLDKSLNCGITMASFKEKYPFFTFVLSPDFDLNQSQLPQQGNMRLDIKFPAPTDESIYVIIYGQFENEIQITANRTILV